MTKIKNEAGIGKRVDALVSGATVIVAGSKEAIAHSSALAIGAQDFAPLASDLAIACKLTKTVAQDFVKLGWEVLQGHVELGLKYLRLCEHIRKNQIGPAQVTEALKALGFHKVRISEVNKLATCSDELWSKYACRELSMKKVLQIERGSVSVEALDLDETEMKEAGLAEGEGASAETVPAKAKTHSVKVALMVKSLQALAGKETGKYKEAKVFNKSGNGIVITIQYIALPAKPAADFTKEEIAAGRGKK